MSAVICGKCGGVISGMTMLVDSYPCRCQWVAVALNYPSPIATSDQQQIGNLTAELRRLRAVLDAARVAAEAGNWNACKAALTGTGGNA